jgi:hypothetical protein
MPFLLTLHKIKEHFQSFLFPFLIPGSRADGRTRTADLLITNQQLYQLSYIGIAPFFKRTAKVKTI